MRTILAIIFMTFATQASAWSENVTRTEANALEDLITLPSGVSFHIPNFLEFDDGFLNQVNREAQVEGGRVLPYIKMQAKSSLINLSINKSFTKIVHFA